MTKEEVRKKVSLFTVYLSCFSSTVRDFVNNRVTVFVFVCILCVCECTEVLNADTCTIFIVFTMMWFGVFLCVWKRGCFAAHSGFLVAFLCTAVVGQVCKTAVGLHLHSQVVVLIGVHWVFSRKKRPPKGHPCSQPELLPKRPFSTTAPKGFSDKHCILYSPHCDNIFFQRLQVPGQRRPEEGEVQGDTSDQRRGAAQST